MVTLFNSKLQVFKKSPNLIILGIFNQLLATQNVNVARFARNFEWDFWGRFSNTVFCIVNFVISDDLFLISILARDDSYQPTRWIMHLKNEWRLQMSLIIHILNATKKHEITRNSSKFVDILVPISIWRIFQGKL